MWLIKNNEEDLKTLSQSSSLNIYSLYAKELTNTPFPKIESLNPSKKKNFNMQDPFAWQK